MWFYIRLLMTISILIRYVLLKKILHNWCVLCESIDYVNYSAKHHSYLRLVSLGDSLFRKLKNVFDYWNYWYIYNPLKDKWIRIRRVSILTECSVLFYRYIFCNNHLTATLMRILILLLLLLTEHRSHADIQRCIHTCVLLANQKEIRQIQI